LSNSKPTKNAIFHGLYSDCTVLDGENPEEFRDLLEAFCDEYSPLSVSEEAAVFDLANLHWKKRRLEARSQRALNMELAASMADVGDSVADSARAAAKSYLKAAEIACDQIFKTMQRVVGKPDQPLDDSEMAEIERQRVSHQQLNILGKELIAPMYHAAEKQKQDQLARAYNPDIMERELKIQAEIDRRIEKALKRLVLIKEYKTFYGAKCVDSAPIQIEALPAKPIGAKSDTGG
jgi:hypothetical protein